LLLRVWSRLVFLFFIPVDLPFSSMRFYLSFFPCFCGGAPGPLHAKVIFFLNPFFFSPSGPSHPTLIVGLAGLGPLTLFISKNECPLRGVYLDGGQTFPFLSVSIPGSNEYRSRRGFPLEFPVPFFFSVLRCQVKL